MFFVFLFPNMGKMPTLLSMPSDPFRVFGVFGG